MQWLRSSYAHCRHSNFITVNSAQQNVWIIRSNCVNRQCSFLTTYPYLSSFYELRSLIRKRSPYYHIFWKRALRVKIGIAPLFHSKVIIFITWWDRILMLLKREIFWMERSNTNPDRCTVRICQVSGFDGSWRRIYDLFSKLLTWVVFKCITLYFYVK